ncbi:hypothetical protein P2Q70_18815 [Pseudomonas mendocina]|uniref:hypothetical protein n=1 Tax=Ectopseudomonas mendocina TaxID=300 RepID=UPI0023D9AE73|nr:hypothetical protein [Pseudomonas mendocina]MDF2076641.1 hypothetical protein [Pseudomonas mendocina]
MKFESFKAVLKACLVSGYGVYPGAGWELVAEAASYLVLRPATHSGYVCFALTGSVIRVSLAATFSGVSGAIIQGDGAKSGISSGNTQPQILYNHAFAQSVASTWMLAADEKTFILNAVSNTMSPTAASPEDFSSNTEYSTLVYAGEDSQGNFIAVGGGAGTSNNATAPSAAFGEPGFTSLKNPQTGLLVSAGSLDARVPLSRSFAVSSLAVASAVFSEISLVRVSWLVPGYFCGPLRGLASAAELSGINTKSCLECIGFSGATTRNLNTPVDLGASNTWIALARDQRYTPLMFMTDAPEYW